MNLSNKLKVNLLIFLIFGTLFLGIMPIIKINDNSKVVEDNKDDSNKIFSTPKLQQAFDPEDWWDYDWSYRANINVTANGTFSPTHAPINFTNRLIDLNINFTELLHNTSEYGTFDENFIRVIEYNSTGKIIGEIPFQFAQGTNYDANSNAIGELSWVLNGTTNATDTRYYFIYFDVTQNGAKSAPDYSNLGLGLTTISEGSDYMLENSRFSVSMNLAWVGGYKSHIYEVINKHSGSEQQCTGPRWGWMLYSWSYGGGSLADLDVMSVVSDGPIKKVVKMINVDPNTNFVYERYYTINYLDDTVQITHTVTAKNSISQGNWYFASWWNPSYGTSSYSAPDSAYGMGGYTFTQDLIPGFSDEYTDHDVYDGMPSGYQYLTNSMKLASWFVDWNREGEDGYTGLGSTDEKYNEGIGTVWDNYGGNFTQLSRYGSYLIEGRRIYLHYRPPALTNGKSFEFNMWGIIFNNTDGRYVENRALGLQDRPLLSSIGETQISGKVLTLHAQDRDSKLIDGAEIELYYINGTAIENQTTDQYGNVTFTGLQNSNYTITTYYEVNETRFKISNITKEINLPFIERKVYQILDCNLTTVNFVVYDEDTNSLLYNAQMKIVNSSGGYIIKSATDVNGLVSFKLPADIYNVSAYYQSFWRILKLNITGAETLKYTHNFSVLTETDINVTISMIEHASTLTINKTTYSKDSNWLYDEKISSQPYSIRVYMNNTVNIIVYYYDLVAESGITLADDKWFTLFSGEIPINESYNLNEIGSGNYSFTLYTSNYDTATYSIMVNLSKRSTNIQDAIIYINFEIKNHTSIIEEIENGLNVYWNDNITLLVNYTTILPEIANISQATVNYSIIGTNIKGAMTNLGLGRYSLEYNTSILDVGTYDLHIFANKTNFDLAIKTFTLTVNEIPTFIDWEIENDYEVTSTFLKIARGELTSVILDYSINSTREYIGPNSDVSILIYNITNVENEDYPRIVISEDQLDGQYKFAISASDFSAGDYQLTFLCHEAHYEDQTELLILRILDSWATTVDLIKPPSFYPWSNNASFIINYFCTEDPRTNRLLSGAAINTLGISVKVGQVFQPFIQLGVADKGDKWGYFDLASDPSYGAGYYQIWFNTSYVNVSESTAYYVSPTLQKSFYSTYTYNPYVWVRPAYTILTPISDKVSIVPVKQIDFYLDQESEITAIYNVSDSISDLNGQLINGATVTLKIRNDTLTNELIKTGSFTVIDAVQNPGEYKYTLKADLLGNFTLSITAIKENYSEGIASIDFSVGTKPINYTLSENIRGTVFFTPQNKEVLISISLNDIVHSTTLSGATIEVGFEGQSYLFHESSTSGVYAITFNDTMLAGVEPDKTYTVQIKAIKTNYTTEEFTLSLDIGLPVDPLLGIPYLYWLIIGATASVALGIYGTTKYIKYKRIPEFIKKLNKVKKTIKSKKSISESLATETKMEYMLESLGDRWEKLGISLEEILGIKGKKLGEIKKESIEAEEKPPESEKEYPEVEKEPPEPEREPSEPEMEYPEPEREPPEPEREPSEPEREPSEPEREPSEPEMEYPEVEKEPSEPEREYPEIEKEPPEPEREYPEPEKEPSEIEKEPPETEKEYDENQEGGSEE